jgi:hypothetical protein
MKICRAQNPLRPAVQWTRLEYANGMNHVVSDDLLVTVLDAMARADPPSKLQETAVINKIALEQGGMYIQGCPWESLTFEGLSIRIRSEHLDGLLAWWRAAPAVSSLGRSFYRFASWPWKCLVVDPCHRAAFLSTVGALSEQAERRAYKFYASRESPQEVLRAHNKSLGLPHVPYGPDEIKKLRS